MMRFCLFSLAFCLVMHLSAQDDLFTRTAHIRLKTSSRMLDMEADNYQVFAKLQPAAGKLEFTGLIKSFEFQLGAANRVLDSKALNVSQYPKILFEGTIKNSSQIDFTKVGNYRAEIEGTLHVWDEKRRTKTNALITVKPDGSVYAKSSFMMVIEEKNVEKVNKLMRERLPAVLSIDTKTLGISRNVQVDVDMVLRKG